VLLVRGFNSTKKQIILERRTTKMKKIILSIAMFAIAMALLIAVIIPLADHGRENGTKAETQIDSVDTNIAALSSVVR